MNERQREGSPMEGRDPDATAPAGILPAGEGTSPLRVLTCGSGGSGKSTLAERLLRDPQGDQDPQADLSRPAARRMLTIADWPSRHDDARSMMAAASQADVALVLVDARQGLETQTRLHLRLASLLGVRHAVLVINKLDLAGYSEAVFHEAAAACQAFCASLGFDTLKPIPISARGGDNLVRRGPHLSWHRGPTLVEHLETVRSGSVPEGAVTQAGTPPETADQFAVHLAWMHEDPMVPGRSYLFKAAGRVVPGSLTEIKHVVDVDTGRHLAAKTVVLNDIAAVNLSLGTAIAIDTSARRRDTNGFSVIDRLSGVTLGAGTIDFALRRSTNIRRQAIDVSMALRGRALGQRPTAIWLTGLSGAGKSTIANLVERRLFGMGRHTYLMDGDNVRHGLNRDLGFTEADRVENIRRVAEVSRLFVDAGLIVLVSLISPFRLERRMARELFDPGDFIEVFVDTPLQIAEQRDPKGLYRKARAGLIKNFTGIDSPYEVPDNPEIHLASGTADPEQLADDVIFYLQRENYLDNLEDK